MIAAFDEPQLIPEIATLPKSGGEYPAACRDPTSSHLASLRGFGELVTWVTSSDTITKLAHIHCPSPRRDANSLEALLLCSSRGRTVH